MLPPLSPGSAACPAGGTWVRPCALEWRGPPGPAGRWSRCPPLASRSPRASRPRPLAGAHSRQRVGLSVPQSVASRGPLGSARSRRTCLRRAPPAPLNRAPLSHSHFACCPAGLFSRGVEHRRLLAAPGGAGEGGAPPPPAGRAASRLQAPPAERAGPRVRACAPGPRRANLKAAVGTSEARIPRPSSRVEAASECGFLG